MWQGIFRKSEIALIFVVLLLLPITTVLASGEMSSPPETSIYFQPESQKIQEIFSRLQNSQNTKEVWESLTSDEKDLVLEALGIPEVHRQHASVVAVKFISYPWHPKGGRVWKKDSSIKPEVWPPGPQWTQNVRFLGRFAEWPPAVTVTAHGPANISINNAIGVANRWGANVDVSAGVVSAGVGFDVNWSSQWAIQCSYNVPVGVWSLKALKQYDVYRYEIWHDPWWGAGPPPYHRGDGVAERFVGVYCYLVKEG